MADKNIEIRINTKANTSGAEAAKKSIADIQNQAESAQEQARQALKEMEAAELAERQAQEVAQINQKATAFLISQAGQAASRAAEKTREFSAALSEVDPETSRNLKSIADGFDVAGAASQGAAYGAAFGGPFGAAIGATAGGGIALVKTELNAALESYARLKEAERIGKDLPKRLEQAKALMVMDEEIESWTKLTDQIELAAKGLKFAAEMNDLRFKNGLKQATADLEISRATGADPKVIKLQEERLKRLEETAFNVEAQNRLKQAYKEEEVAAAKLQEAEETLRIKQAGFSGLSVEAKKEATREIKKLNDDITKLQTDLADARTALLKAKTADRLGMETREKETTAAEVKTQQGETIVSLSTLLDAVKDSGKASPEMESAVAAIEKAAKDGSLSKEDLGKVELFLAQWRDSLLRIGVLPETYEKAVKAVNDLDKRMRDIESKLPDTRTPATVSASQGGFPAGMNQGTGGLPFGMVPGASGAYPAGMMPSAGGSFPAGMQPGGVNGLPAGMAPGAAGLPPGMMPGASGLPAGMTPGQPFEQMKTAVTEGIQETQKIGEITGLLKDFGKGLGGLSVVGDLLRQIIGDLDGHRRDIEGIKLQMQK